MWNKTNLNLDLSFLLPQALGLRALGLSGPVVSKSRAKQTLPGAALYPWDPLHPSLYPACPCF